ncbi:MAG: GIY-YIG nuclease family protein [Bacteroidales bacterium]|nr:GIY-YIG nuclease family protein [Bacteroidales bacterium]
MAARIKEHNYFVYITTNKNKTVLYTGVTNNIKNRLYYHELDINTETKHFTGRYNVHFLLYWERFQYIQDAIAREKEIKGWVRAKKVRLIQGFNPDWVFLNDTL